MKYLLVVLISCLILTSCNKIERPEKPKDLISQDKMVDILYDVFVFNAAKSTDRKLLEEHNVTPDAYIYKKFNIDSLQFVRSNEYYSYDVKTYEDIISKVEARLIAKKTSIEKKMEQEEERRKKRLDSIQKLGDSVRAKKSIKKLKTD